MAAQTAYRSWVEHAEQLERCQRLLRRVSKFCSRMKIYLPLHKSTIIRTAGAGAPRLLARLLPSSTAKIRR